MYCESHRALKYHMHEEAGRGSRPTPTLSASTPSSISHHSALLFAFHNPITSPLSRFTVVERLQQIQLMHVRDTYNIPTSWNRAALMRNFLTYTRGKCCQHDCPTWGPRCPPCQAVDTRSGRSPGPPCLWELTRPG